MNDVVLIPHSDTASRSIDPDHAAIRNDVLWVCMTELHVKDEHRVRRVDTDGLEDGVALRLAIRLPVLRTESVSE